MKYDAEQLKLVKGKILSQIIITAISLFIIVFVHEWTHDRLLTLATIWKIALILLLFSTSIWVIAYLIRYLFHKFFNNHLHRKI